MKKICVVTGTRAEYGLLEPLMEAIEADAALKLQLIVTGMHLSPEFGYTVDEIAKRFAIDERIEMLLSSDTPVGTTKSIGMAMIGFADAYARLRPDILLVLGDRFETFAAVAATVGHGIAVAHLHGGETTEGAIDEQFRHAITKMSHLHFTSTEIYRRRVVAMGEAPDRVFKVGAIGVEWIRKMNFLGKKALESSLGFSLEGKVVLVTHHPVTMHPGRAIEELAAIMMVLEKRKDLRPIFTYANADSEGRALNAMIDDFVTAHPHRSAAFASLGHLRYLSLMRCCFAVIGNSSSGIIEAPSIGVPTLNIGDRQSGRMRAESVLDCRGEISKIEAALDRLASETFREKLAQIQNPYEGTNTVGRIVEILASVDTVELLAKRFYEKEGDV